MLLPLLLLMMMMLMMTVAMLHSACVPRVHPLLRDRWRCQDSWHAS
jgi:hypothetical protein